MRFGCPARKRRNRKERPLLKLRLRRTREDFHSTVWDSERREGALGRDNLSNDGKQTLETHLLKNKDTTQQQQQHNQL